MYILDKTNLETTYKSYIQAIVQFQTASITGSFNKRSHSRTEEDIINLILEGVSESGKSVTHEIIPKEIEAIKHAIDNAEDGSFITALSDVVANAINIVQEYLDKENEDGNI